MARRSAIVLADAIISIDDGPEREQLELFFDTAGSTRPAGPSPERVLRCATVDRTIDVPTHEPPTFSGPVRRWRRESTTYLAHDDGRTAVVDDDDLVMSAADGDGEGRRSLQHLLADGLSDWFARRSAAVVHGGAVGRDGRVVLLLGPTGSGKSTAAVAALANGLDVYADDLVVVTSGATGPAVHGIPKPVMVDRLVAAEIEPTAVAGPSVGDARKRVRIEPTKLTRGPATLVGIVVIEHADGEATLTARSHADTLHALVCSAFETPHGDVARVLSTIAAAAALPGFDLGHDRDPAVRLRRTGRLLWRVLDQTAFTGGDLRHPSHPTQSLRTQSSPTRSRLTQ